MLPYDLEKSRKLAMTIGGEGRWRSVGPTHWEKAARLCFYPPESALAAVGKIISDAPEAAHKVLRERQQAGLKSPALKRLVAQLEKRCASLQPFYT